MTPDDKSLTIKQIAEQIYASGVSCNCDLDNWVPEGTTGHTHACRIHQTAVRRWLKSRGMGA